MNLTLAKILAIAGLLLTLLFGSHGIASIAGLILYLIGMHGLREAYGEERIFRYALYSSIAVLVAVIVIAVVVGVGILMAPLTGGLSIGATVAAGLAILYAAVLATGYYKKKLMETLAPHADSGIARLTGKLYWYGAILTIVIVGLLIVLLAAILEAIVIATLRQPQGYQPGRLGM